LGTERFAFRRCLDKAKTNRTMLIAVVLVAYGFFLRSVHLLNHGHYFIVSSDSYFFHRLAQGIMAGEPLPSSPGANVSYTLHSGIAYPLAYIAKALSYAFNVPSAEALKLASEFLPLLLGIISLLVIYVAATRIFNRAVGLFSAFAWALMVPAILLGAAGFIDRDSLSLLLIMTGAFLFYLSGTWHMKIANMDIGWLIGGLAVLAIEGLVYLEWGAPGTVLLPFILTVYFVVKFLREYFGRMETEPNTLRRLATAISQTNWHTFSVIMLGNIGAVAAFSHKAAYVFNYASGLVQLGNGTGIAEKEGISFFTVLIYGFFSSPW